MADAASTAATTKTADKRMRSLNLDPSWEKAVYQFQGRLL
jgi:hypothetical protein